MNQVPHWLVCLFVYVELLDLSLAPDLPRVSAEGHNLLLGDDVGKVSLGTGKSHTLDGGCSLSGVLEVHTKVNTSCLAGCKDKRKENGYGGLREKKGMFVVMFLHLAGFLG